MLNRINVSDLRPGDIGFGSITGAAGVLVGLGQMMLGDDSRYRHVFVVVADGIAVEAMPTGARLVSLWEHRFGPGHVYIRPRYESDFQGRAVARHAREMVGTPYGFSDYLALALRHWGIRWSRLDRWISRVTDSGYPARAICSQLADHAMMMSDFHVFTDGRLPQDVTPGALFYRLLELSGTLMYPKGDE